jgi:hypothetical protein
MDVAVHADIHDEVRVSTDRPNPVKQRRSQRILLSVAVQVGGRRADGTAFKEECSTVVVNAHGAMILLRERVRESQELKLKNIKTGEQAACVVRDVQTGPNGPEVGVEFTEPHPRFWRVAFPPADWSPRSPEAKRFALPRASAVKPAR